MQNKVFFSVFVSIWVILAGLNFLWPQKAFSEQENRYLAKLPDFSFEDLVNGEYSAKLDNYINDHFVFRNFWLKLNSTVQLVSGKTENNNIYIGKNGYLFDKFKYGEAESKNLQTAVNVINNFAEKTGLPTYLLFIPNSAYINSDKLPENVKTPDEQLIIGALYEKCSQKVQPVDVAHAFWGNKEKALYFKTDHHMTSLGAYLVYEEFCKAANMESASLNDFKKEIVSTTFLGTFDSKAQVRNQEPDTITVYKNDINQNVEGDYDGATYNSLFNSEYLSKKDKYSYFLNGNNAKVVVKTSVKNGKKLLVIKDSYAHILAQFLCNNYEEIHFVDPRYYNLPLSSYVLENGITETLFLYNISNLASDIGIRGVK